MPSIAFDKTKWQKIQEEYNTVQNLADHLIALVNSTDTLSSPVEQGISDEANRIKQNATALLDYLNNTPSYDPAPNRQKLVKTDYEAEIEAQLQTDRVLLLRDLRSAFVRLWDLHGEVIQTQDPKPEVLPAKPFPWRPVLIAGVILAIPLLVFLGINTIYDNGISALEQSQYEKAIDHLAFLDDLPFTYRATPDYLDDSYAGAIRTATYAEDYGRAEELALAYLNRNLNDETMLDLYHDLYETQYDEIVRQTQDPESTSEQELALWRDAQQVLLTLEDNLQETIQPILVDRYGDRLATALEDQLVLSSDQVNDLETTYISIGRIHFDNEDWEQVRQTTSEDALGSYTWIQWPEVGQLYLDSLLREAELAAAVEIPDWTLIEARVIELIDLLDGDRLPERFNRDRYRSARLVREALRLEDVILLFDQDQTITDAVWQDDIRPIVQETLASLPDVPSSYYEDADPFDEDVIETYRTERQTTVQLLSDNQLDDTFQRERTLDDIEEQLQRFSLSLLFESFYAPASTAFEAELYQSARDAFKQLIDERGESYRDAESMYYDTFLVPATTAYEQDKYATTVTLLNELFELAPDYSNTEELLKDSLLQLGIIAINEKEYDEAEQRLEELQAIDPDYRDLKDRLSEVYYALAIDIIASVDPAAVESVFTPYAEAREFLEKLTEINPGYRNTPSLIRETYYQPIALTLAQVDTDPDSAVCRDMRDRLQDQIDDDPGFEDFRNTRLLVSDTYYCEAQAAFNRAQQLDASQDPEDYEQAMEEARVSIEASGLDLNYKDINTLIVQTFYQPAAEYFRLAFFDPAVTSDAERQQSYSERAQDLLERLRENNERFYITYQDAWTIYQSTRYIPAYQAFVSAQATFNETGTSDQWQSVRDAIEPLLDEAPIFAPPLTYQPEGAETTIGELLATDNLLSAHDLYAETYYIPGRAAFDSQDWATAREEFAALQAFAPGYRDSSRLYRDAYYIPGATAFEAIEYARAAELLSKLVSIDRNYRPDPASPTAFDLLRDAYALPINTAYEIALSDPTSPEWDIVLDNLTGLVELDPSYSANLPLPAEQLLQEALYQRALLAQDNAMALAVSDQETVQLWQIALDSLVEVLLINADPEIPEPNLLSNDILTPYRDSQERLRGVFHELARAALLAEEWEQARQAAFQLLTIDPEDELANEQYRDSFYLEGQTLLGQMAWADARDSFIRLLRLDSPNRNPFNAEPAYQDADALLLQAYHDDMTARLTAEEWDRARTVADDLREYLPDDELANETYREAYYQEALIAIEERAWSEARELLTALLEEDAGRFNNILLEVDTPYRDAQAQYRSTYIIPATEDLDAGNWRAARRVVQPLLNLDPQATNANGIIIESYLRPAREAFDTGSWGDTRRIIDTMLDEREAQNLASNPDIYAQALGLYARTYIEVARSAAELEDWQAVRVSLLGGLPRLYDEFLPDDDEGILQLREDAQTLLADSYLTSVDRAIAAQDWTTARTVLALLTQAKENSENSDWYPDQTTLDTYFGRVYIVPIQDAIANGDLGAAQAAYTELTQQPFSNLTSNQAQILVFEEPLQDAIQREDWLGAAELYRALRNEQIMMSTIDQLLQTTPRLLSALQGTYVTDWVHEDIDQETLSFNLPDLTFGDGTVVVTNTSGTRAWVGDTAGLIRVVDLNHRTLEAVIVTQQDAILDMVIDPMGRWVATSHLNQTITVWNGDSFEPIATLSDHDDAIIGLHVSGDVLISASVDGTLLQWDTTSWSTTPIDVTLNNPLTAIGGTSDGALLVVASPDALQLVTLETDTVVDVTVDHAVAGITFSPDDTSFVAYGNTERITLWSSDGTLQRVIDQHTDWVRAAVYLGDGELLATQTADGILRLFDPDTSALLNTLSGNTLLAPMTTYDMTSTWDADVLLSLGSGSEIIYWSRHEEGNDD
jgi:hypothetical protein